MTDRHSLEQEIERLWQLTPAEAARGHRRDRRGDPAPRRGLRQVAEKEGETWIVHEWVKKAILLYFRLRRSEPDEVGPFSFFDKVPVKRIDESHGVRVVPPAVARYGAFLSPGVVLMPSYVNIGAWVGPRTMVDTWATVGSCAQIGADVHLSGGVGIGGVLEPPQATPGGDRGRSVRRLPLHRRRRGSRRAGGRPRRERRPRLRRPRSSTSPGDRPVESRGYRAAAIRGDSRHATREFPAGTYGLPAALIIGTRSASTDLKVSLNDALRSYGVAV